MSDIPDIFHNQDTIFHYCKTSTAIENILFERQLRLSSRKGSNDPIEYKSIDIFEPSAASPEDTEELEKSTNDCVENIRKDINERIDNIRQACFCKNKILRKTNLIDYPKEFFGFLKPRMWDQYGDNYKGVCLAFSKRELLKNQKILLKDNVKYLPYEGLMLRDNNIDRNEIMRIGCENHKRNLNRYFDKLMFRKHKDYRDESEYRICTITEKEYDTICIEKSIKGIIFSHHHINEYSRRRLVEYSKDLKIDLLYINWKADGISLKRELYPSTISNNIQEFKIP
ncbi:MAG: DUF2971 domain-containing protein [Flavobacteriaceae bacterium]|nr:DUF2971 domain-containing protein [Flavobacteriaceae bacterium]